jgi:hypothetical protein
MEAISILTNTFGTLFLVGTVAVVFYVFYRLLKHTFTTVKDNDD